MAFFTTIFYGAKIQTNVRKIETRVMGKIALIKSSSKNS